MKKEILILLLCILSTTIFALGDSCTVAIPMPYTANSSITGNSLTGDQRWFTFVPLTSEVEIKLTNTNPTSGHIHDMVLFEGMCHPKFFTIGRDTRGDTTLKIQMHDLIVGIPYFIRVSRERPTCSKCTSGAAAFDLNVNSITPPTLTTSGDIIFYNGKPSHVKGEVVARINKTYLVMSAINDVTQPSGYLPTFIQDTVMIQEILNSCTSSGFHIGIREIKMRKVHPKFTQADSISLSRQGEQIRVPDFWETFVITIPDTMKIFFVARALSDINGIRFAEPNFVFEKTSVPNDAFYATFGSNLHSTGAWSNANINVEGAWDISTGVPTVRVGVYDTGIDQNHTELDNGKVVDGFDYFNNTALTSPFDNDDHGTACAGIIAADRNNSSNIAGIAGGDAATSNPGVSLCDIKIAKDGSTFVTLSKIADAILAGSLPTPSGYGLHVMNHSWSSQQSSSALHDQIQNADQHGVVVVAARGNFPDVTPKDKQMYPSCYQDEMVINVGASGRDGEWKTSGNGNVSNSADNTFESMIKNNVDVIAPGTSTVVRTVKAQTTNGFMVFNGTSAAAPHVSGVAALMCSYINSASPALQNLTIEDVENIIQMSASDKSASPASVGYDEFSGWGLLDASAALNKIKSPQFKIQHFGVNQNATSSKTRTMIQSHKQVNLVFPFGTLAAGIYYADLYEETITLNYSLSDPTNDQIITSWPRFSSTIGWDQSNPQTTDNYCQIISVTPTQAVLKTWSYNFLYDQNGALIVDPWYPTPNSQKAALTIYTMHKAEVGLNEYNRDGSQIVSVFPNPAKNNISTNITLLSSQEVTMEIYDTQGKLMKTISNGKLPQG